MATALQLALQQFVGELGSAQAQALEAQHYARQIGAIVVSQLGDAFAKTPAVAIQECWQKIVAIAPAQATSESNELLQGILAKLQGEISSQSSVFHAVSAGASNAGLDRVPKQSRERMANDADANMDGAEDDGERAKRARTGEDPMPERPAGAGSGPTFNPAGSDRYDANEDDDMGAGAGAGSSADAGSSSGGAGAGASSSGAGAGASSSAAGAEAADSPYLQFRIIKNDGSRRNLIWLTQVKNIFAAQLPKMPREYIARLVFDRKHRSMLVIKKDRVVGGICFRPFLPQKFAEIAFCAITASEQVKGYGTRLMNHTKEAVKMDGITHFLTYADNYAIGYFKKQGFSKVIKLAPEQWVGYIKDYDGGTLMEAEILGTVNYLEIPKMTAAQKEQVQKSIASVSKKDVVRRSPHTPEGAAAWSRLGANASLIEKAVSLPGFKEAGYGPQHVQPRSSKGGLSAYFDHPMGKSHLKASLEAITKDVANYDQSAPFRDLIVGNDQFDRDYPEYKDMVKNPMDLPTIAKKAKAGLYRSFEHWMHDVQLMTNNCRVYNRPDSEYVACASRVDAFVQTRIRQPGAWVVGWAQYEQYRLAEAAKQQASAGPQAGAGASSAMASSS